MRLRPVPILLVVGSLVSLCAAQNCPILGPAYPAASDAAAPAFASAKTAFDEALAKALASGQIDGNTTFYSIQVFSPSSEDPIYETYHTASTGSQNGPVVTVGPDTLFRIFSISKVMTVYTILRKLGDRFWNEPITKYVPELVAARARNAVDDVLWDDVTLGSLASLTSGIGRDYALEDLSAGGLTGVPGLRVLNESEIVKCGSTGLKPCTRAEAMEMILARRPFAPSYHTPLYSNMAFQLLAYAVENITGRAFTELVRSQVVQPLNLRRTFLSKPAGNDTTNAVIVDGWDFDFGDEAPTGGYYQSVSDLSALGASILNSTLLPPKTTREWLKPVTHTSSLLTSIGRPWEIARRNIPVAPSNSTAARTRVVDIYTKQGGSPQYVSLLALSPDHNLGISILTAGPSAQAALDLVKPLSLQMWPTAAEQAARDQARVNFAGRYALPDGNSSAEIGFLPDEPGLYLSQLVSDGTDMFALVQAMAGAGRGETRAWLYPTGLVDQRARTKRIAFRAVLGDPAQSAGDDCSSWAEGDRLAYGGYPGDLLIFEVGEDGRATGLEVPLLNKTLTKDNHIGARGPGLC